jgi:aconitate hydratase
LISQGILPLRFKDESDYDRFEQGQKWELPDLRQRLEKGDDEIPARMDGTEITLLAEYSQRERNILLAGGILRRLRHEEPVEASVVEVSGEASSQDPRERNAGDYPNPEVPRG